MLARDCQNTIEPEPEGEVKVRHHGKERDARTPAGCAGVRASFADGGGWIEAAACAGNWAMA
jgi:hypothetical protein